MKTLALLAIMATPAAAQQCGGYADALAVLAEQYGEELIISGTTDTGALLQTFANPDTGTWTILAVYPDNLACLVSAGGAFKQHRFKPNT